MKIIQDDEFDAYWKSLAVKKDDGNVNAVVQEIIAAVRAEGDAAVRRYAAKFDKSSPEQFEAPLAVAAEAWDKLKNDDAELAASLELAAEHIKRFSLEQKKQFAGFEYEMEDGLITGQRVIPVERAAIYVPGGRFPLISTVLMGVVPALCAGVNEVILASPPLEDGFPDARILAAAYLAASLFSSDNASGADAKHAALRIFSVGGAQAIAALAIGTESIPRVDVIAGPGNKYVAAAKRILFGEVGIDFVAGPTDVLIIASDSQSAALAAADMLAQAEHDPDARARVLVPSREFADKISAALEQQLAVLPTSATARASLDAGGLIIVYKNKDEAIRIANIIAPEHLELQIADADDWIPGLKNYGSLFIGPLAAEVLGDYSAGINHTLPTSGSARFTGGLSVRHFLKTVTSLRCARTESFEKTRRAAECIARAEGLAGHAQSAAGRAESTFGRTENAADSAKNAAGGNQ